MRQSLIDLLRADIEYHDSAMMTTPHLSRIRNKEEELLKLLTEGNVARPAGEANPSPNTFKVAVDNMRDLLPGGIGLDFGKSDRDALSEHERLHALYARSAEKDRPRLQKMECEEGAVEAMSKALNKPRKG